MQWDLVIQGTIGVKWKHLAGSINPVLDLRRLFIGIRVCVCVCLFGESEKS